MAIDTTTVDVDDLRQRARSALDRCRNELLNERTADGHWVGELAGSALSTATAVSAIAATIKHDPDCQDGLVDLIVRGIQYLGQHQNPDGGFGDTDRSHSNIATSYLVLAAATLASDVTGQTLASSQLDALRHYIHTTGGQEALRRRYGKDKTFVVPICCNLAVAGLISWDDVQALPFEAAVFPQSMYRFLQMPVVSYAIPALVAIGQARHFLGRRSLFPLRLVRSASVKRTMRVLSRMQPDSGGYLEATPLTSFVIMSLAATKRADCEVAKNGLQFLKNSIRDDGSWPIDTNLATWVTSLSVHALACDPDDDGSWCSDSLVDWQLSCQHKQRHPFTGANPGGWGWTDLSGAVPDADDTPGAMLALLQARRWVSENRQTEIDHAVAAGNAWLTELQNRNGGWPTFCRGWGKLPFDRSSTDLTAHALRAISSLRRIKRSNQPNRLRPPNTARAVDLDQDPDPRERAAKRFLSAQQRSDGSWLPLWFGNQDLPDEINPVYGTSRVLLSDGANAKAVSDACNFLLLNQNADGGWGGGISMQPKLTVLSQRISRSKISQSPSVSLADTPQQPVHCPQDLLSSVEETALAVEALATIVLKQRDLGVGSGVKTGRTDSDSTRQSGRSSESVAAGGKSDLCAAIITGVEFLLRSIDDGRHRVPWPIGFYFAKLWYHERLYPLVFTTAALGKYLRAAADQHDTEWPR